MASTMKPTDITAYMAHVGAAARARLGGDGRCQQRREERRAAARWPRRLRDKTARAAARQRAATSRPRSAAGLAAPLIDRLKLTPQIIDTVAAGCEQIAAMADPVGEISGVQAQPSGISVGRMRVPLGRLRHDLREPART